jgi:hypothetical protein
MSKFGYPSHLIPNSQKNRDWILRYCRAAYKEFNSQGGKIFYGARYQYATIRDYAMGTQSISKYKKMLEVDESQNDSWLAIDWSILPIASRFRRQAIAKLTKRSYNIMINPIDPTSEVEKKKYKAKQEAKIKLTDALAKVNPQLAQNSELQFEENEPRDLEELEIHMDFSYKHKLSEELEEVVSNILNLNNYQETRQKLLQDVFDFGVCGVKECIEDGAVKVRHVRPENVVSSYCMNRDFSDAQHIGELRMMSIADIRRLAGDSISEEQFMDIAERHMSKFNNPTALPPSRGVGSDYDSFSIPVLDIEFMSVNTLDVETRVDKRGNKIVSVLKTDKKRKTNSYSSKHYKVVYKCKWIVDTEYAFDYGIANNMKRKNSSMTETSLNYHLFAPEFYDMRATSIMEQVIPIIDAIQLAWFKLQNAIATARPKGIQIALDAIENIPLGAGGQELKPEDVIDLFNKKGTLVYRYLDTNGNPSPYKPIEEIENGLGRDIATYYSMIEKNIQFVRDITGVNEYVDGSSVDPRTLSNVTRLAEEASNNSLYGCVEADRFVLQETAKSVVVHVHDLIKFKNYHESYITALGSETIEYLSKQESVSPREYGLLVEDRPDVIEKEKFKQIALQYVGQGMIELEDLVLIDNAQSLKKVQFILAYRMKKRKAEKMQESMMLQQQNAQVQQQSIQAKMQADAEIMNMKHQFNMQIEELKGLMRQELEKVKAGMQESNPVQSGIDTNRGF